MNYFLALFSGLALAGAGLWLRRRHPRFGVGLVAVGTIACVGTITWQVRTALFSSAPPTLDRYSATAAYFMGQAVLDELRSFQGTVYLVLPPDRGHNARELDSIFNTFARVLVPVAGLQVKDVVVQTSERDLREGRLSPAALAQALATATGAVACVSFVGWPRESTHPPPVPGTRAPLWFVFDPSGGTAWHAALKQGRIRRVIVPRPDAEREGHGALIGPPDELFGRFFLMARPHEADGVARALTRRSSVVNTRD